MLDEGERSAAEPERKVAAPLRAREVCS
jgi:hypothetical protein